MLAATTAIQGWDVVFALVILLAAVLLERLVVSEIPWVAWTTLFLVAMFGLALTVKW